MNKRMAAKARLDYYCKEDTARNLFVHYIGYFDSYISEGEARLITALLSTFVSAGEQLLLAFYPINEKWWQKVDSEPWVTLCTKIVMRWGLFRRKPTLWIVGHALTVEKFREVFMYAWNISGNDTMLAIPAKQEHTDTLVQAFTGLSENFDQIFASYPIVASRGHDGLWLEIYSKDVNPNTFLAKLHGACDREIVYRDSPL